MAVTTRGKRSCVGCERRRVPNVAYLAEEVSWEVNTVEPPDRAGLSKVRANHRLVRFYGCGSGARADRVGAPLGAACNAATQGQVRLSIGPQCETNTYRPQNVTLHVYPPCVTLVAVCDVIYAGFSNQELVLLPGCEQTGTSNATADVRRRPLCSGVRGPGDVSSTVHVLVGRRKSVPCRGRDR
ncbi:hypothetical protein BHM03_00034313 [Ensete ventricosum]|nr:hypothetical protein BHM03_00034313 [Ensete ventricosum]